MKSAVQMQVAHEVRGEEAEPRESLTGLFHSLQAVDYPELREQMLRLAVGMSAFEYQIETALRSSREHVRETERALWRATLRRRNRVA